MTTTHIITEARRILNATETSAPLCTWVGSVAEQRAAAQRALDGDTADLELMLDMDAAELWQLPRWDAEEWMGRWMPTASESTSVTGMAA